MDNPNFNANPLIPAIVQDAQTGTVLMMAWMNEEAYRQTKTTGRVTFYSRSRQQLWVKGETSGNSMELVSMHIDCDADTLLVKVNPAGPACHTGADTCWNETNQKSELAFLTQLEEVIRSRATADPKESYTALLLQKGPKKAAQKVGEEAAELLLEAMDNQDDLFLEEAADLLYHYLVLLRSKGFSLSSVVEVLRQRHK